MVRRTARSIRSWDKVSGIGSNERPVLTTIPGNVQIIFDGFNEYNFYIDVVGSQYEATKNGLDLVEQEMPASISFHVPDQYHKRIIGIGGQHIQRIMKKYSVFVKFSNAMDRGGLGKEDEDVKVDNVICRTPARNAQSLDLVKQEIMDMVEKVDAEFVSETVLINRLYHRELICRLPRDRRSREEMELQDRLSQHRTSERFGQHLWSRVPSPASC